MSAHLEGEWETGHQGVPNKLMFVFWLHSPLHFSQRGLVLDAEMARHGQ